MTKWLGLGATGVLLLVAGVLLITSGASVTAGQVLGVLGVGLILVAVVVFPLAARWAIFRTKGRAALFGASILGRVLKVVALLAIAAVAVVAYLAA